MAKFVYVYANEETQKREELCEKIYEEARPLVDQYLDEGRFDLSKMYPMIDYSENEINVNHKKLKRNMVLVQVVERGSLRDLERLSSSINDDNVELLFSVACQKGKIGIMEYLMNRELLEKSGYHPTSRSYIVATKEDRVESVEFLHKQGVPWNHECVFYAVHYKAPKCLKYMLDNGCSYEEKKDFTIKTAQKYGDAEIMSILGL